MKELLKFYWMAHYLNAPRLNLYFLHCTCSSSLHAHKHAFFPPKSVLYILLLTEQQKHIERLGPWLSTQLATASWLWNPRSGHIQASTNEALAWCGSVD